MIKHRSSVNQRFPKFSFQKIDKNDVLKVIKSLKTKKPAGWDEIPLEFIKKVSHFIAETLSIIINQLFQSHKFPET